MIKREKLALILPAYNEELTIKECITDFYNALPETYFVIVNNNSSDNTQKLAEDTLKELGAKGIVLFEPRQGKSNAVKTGFRSVDADIYYMVDADCTYKAKDLERLLKPVQDCQYDIVIGDRHHRGDYKKENKRKFHNFGNNLVKNIINLLFKSNLNDILSGYRIMSRKFVKNYPILNTGFELETEMTLYTLHRKFRIKELPIQYEDRPEGSVSKLNTYKDGTKVLLTILWIFKNSRPLIFFSSLSAIFLLLSLTSGAPVIIEFLKTSYVAHVPLAILATGLAIFSLLLFAVGLLLDTVVTIDKTTFEVKMNNYHEKY